MPASTISPASDPRPSHSAPTREVAAPETNRAAIRKPPAPRLPDRNATDDEILGIGGTASGSTSGDRAAAEGSTPDVLTAGDASDRENMGDPAEPVGAEQHAANVPEALRAAFDAHPELRRVWDDAQAYRAAFATPEAARAATAQVADLNRLDALFFSRRPEDHAELARAVAGLDPVAFASLAQAMTAQVASAKTSLAPRENAAPNASQATSAFTSQPTPAQVEFFQSTNDAAVRGVLEAIESQVERLLPEGISKSARNRVVGEIYRELDTTLRSNRELGEQMRQAFRSGALDAAHQRAIVSLVNGRARQALPGVARRVLSEWTSTLVAANQDRRARQRAAERRVDIAGASGGNDGRRAMTPRDLDYARLSDSDILNL